MASTFHEVAPLLVTGLVALGSLALGWALVLRGLQRVRFTIAGGISRIV